MIEGIIGRMRKAASVAEIRKLMNYANWTQPTGQYRRAFLKAAKLRMKQLNEQQ